MFSTFRRSKEKVCNFCVNMKPWKLAQPIASIHSTYDVSVVTADKIQHAVKKQLVIVNLYQSFAL